MGLPRVAPYFFNAGTAMKYERILKAEFIERPNRFIAHINIDGEMQVCHVKNTGRCRELLTPHAEVYVQQSDNPNRKTGFDLIAVKKGSRIVNMDSQVPNKVVYEWLINEKPFGDLTLIKPEYKYKNSRFDFYLERENEKFFVEVKGVTLENNNIVSFPDAPSERAVKHLTELMEATKNGYSCYVVFVIQMSGTEYFMPNYENDPLFTETLEKALNNNIKAIAFECNVTPNSIGFKKYIPTKI